jgi:type I restriction-modification system DNA methylase subunit
MLTSETKRRIDACRDVLVGKLPQPSNQVELITLALIYKFMDDLDEESVKLGGKRSFFVNGLTKYRWRNLLPQTVSAEERVTLFSEGVEALGHPKKAAHLPGLFRDIFRNAFLKFRDGRILTMFLTEVNGFAYSHSEELGNAFEYLLQCTGAQGENGQFRTPRHVIDFIVACLDPQPGDKILDPACGTGGFLVSAYRHILAQHTSPHKSRSSGRESAPSELGKKSEPTHVGCYSSAVIPGDLLTFAQRQQVYKNLAGYDVDDQMVKLSKVNLFLHGFPDPAIHIYDTLSNDARWHEKADLILANPPFMTPKGGVTPHTKFRIAAKKAEVLFTDYIAEHLSGDGRGGVIVPNGIVATTQNAYVKLRRFLVEDSLVAVVSLPAGVFKPYSGVKTSILLLDKKLARQTKEILFLKITADGFDLGDKRNPIEANDLPEAERVVKAWLKGMLNDEWRMTNATGAIGSTKGATPSQPGATPQVTNPANRLQGQRPGPFQHGATPHDHGPKTNQGPTARPISAATMPADGSGLQPSEMFLNDAPGALPQAGMGSAVGAGVVWKRVEKMTLLEHRACTLQVEPFLGNGSVASDSTVVRLADVVEVNPGKTEARSLPPETEVSFVPMEDLLTDRPDFVQHASVRLAKSSPATPASATATYCLQKSRPSSRTEKPPSLLASRRASALVRRSSTSSAPATKSCRSFSTTSSSGRCFATRARKTWRARQASSAFVATSLRITKSRCRRWRNSGGSWRRSRATKKRLPVWNPTSPPTANASRRQLMPSGTATPKAPTARLHPSLGQRPRSRIANEPRAESPTYRHATTIIASSTVSHGWIAPLALMGFVFTDFLGRCPRLE